VKEEGRKRSELFILIPKGRRSSVWVVRKKLIIRSQKRIKMDPSRFFSCKGGKLDRTKKKKFSGRPSKRMSFRDRRSLSNGLESLPRKSRKEKLRQKGGSKTTD